MDTSKIEYLLETLIDEIRDVKKEIKNINEELDWWSKDKHSFAKQLLSAVDRIKL